MRSAPMHCPTRVVAAIWNAKPGINDMDSAVSARLFAAIAAVPRVAMAFVTKIPEEDMQRRSSMAGRLIRKIFFMSFQSIR